MSDEASFSDSTSTLSGNPAFGSTMASGVRPAIEEAGQAVKTAVSDVASQTRQSVGKAAEKVQRAGVQAVGATKAYANEAVDAAGRRLRDVRTRLETAKTSTNQYIHEDPVRAVTMAAIAGALLSAAFMLLARRGR